MRPAPSARMRSACGIEIQSHELIPGQAIKASAAAGNASASIGESPVPTVDAASFDKKLQAILDALQSLGEAAGKGVPQANEEAGLVFDRPSGPVPATAFRDINDRDANGASESSPQMTRPPGLTGIGLRMTLQPVPSRDLPPSRDANPASSKTGVHDSALRSQKATADNHKPAKMETVESSVTTISSVSPEFPLTLLSAPVVKPSGQASSAPEAPDPTAPPSGERRDNINTLPGVPDVGRPILSTNAERDDEPASASSPLQLDFSRTSADIGNADRLILPGSEKLADLKAAPSTSSSRSLQITSSEESAYGSASTTQTYHRPNPPGDTMFEHGKRTGAPTADALKPENPPRDRISIPEVPAPPRTKSDKGISPIHAPAVSAGTPALLDARAGLFAASPTAGIAQLSDSGGTTWLHPNRVEALEPFMAVDAGMDDTAARWIRTGGHRAEAGFQDSSLGWVSVRAQAGAGGIHAVVVPSSDGAAQVLGSHLAGLNAHMASQYEHLNPVTLSPPDAEWNSRDTGRDMAQGDGTATSHGGHQQPMHEDPEPPRLDRVPHSVRGFAEPQSAAPMQALTAGSTSIDGHVSFIV